MEYKQIYNDYKCENLGKLKRAIEGVVQDDGQPKGGVGEDSSEDVILAEYDRLGGYITKDGYKVQTGAFCNTHESKKAKSLVMHKKPEPILEVIGVNGTKYEIEEGADLPLEAQLSQEVSDKPGKKKKVVRIKKKKVDAKKETN